MTLRSQAGPRGDHDSTHISDQISRQQLACRSALQGYFLPLRRRVVHPRQMIQSRRTHKVASTAQLERETAAPNKDAGKRN
ncbi:hypothetical protein P171DRAFT_437333 [Karstenula rhodostoma CBS 690.94]|uniref:Uncharacterized protein n=1 Tax=Karstenula rhodostoma CBS 690.94 TaxID=1392251 RepID=A0A9P4P841_9PLEO|nr:hypothetical protein P171DRAFT_437333 [Karstenula rhodostoma CBS 690.94]